MCKYQVALPPPSHLLKQLPAWRKQGAPPAQPVGSVQYLAQQGEKRPSSTQFICGCGCRDTRVLLGGQR